MCCSLWLRIYCALIGVLPVTVTRSSHTAEIARDAEMAIQGHSRSCVVVPTDAAYMTSYLAINSD